MSPSPGSGSKPPDAPASGSGSTRGTVGVYDRPASADKPSALPKVITAVIVVAMLVLTYLFWPKSTAPSSQDMVSPAATTNAPANTTASPAGTGAPTGPAPGAGPAAATGETGTSTSPGTSGSGTTK